MAQDDLPSLIRRTAARARTDDFIWSAAITAGIFLVIGVSGYVSAPWLPLVAWLAFLAALLVRYRLSAGRLWAQPVQRVIESELNAQRAELEKLRLARGIAEALPEPLFILDAIGLIEHANPAARSYLGTDDLEDRHFASAMRAPEVFEALDEIAAGGAGRVVDFSIGGDVERHCRAFVAPLGDPTDAGAPPHRALVYVRDLTGEQRLERMRADFVASASHELRTPLAALLGYIETLRGPARDDAKAREEFLVIMQAQGERMQRLVADLMSLSRIELREHVPPRDAVDLESLAAHVAESLKPVTDNLGASVTVRRADDGADGPAIVVGDRDQLIQTAQNLIDNAAKYGGDNAAVKVTVGIGEGPSLPAPEAGPAKASRRAHVAGETVADVAARQRRRIDDYGYIQVRDSGPGVAREDLPRLTERFYRVSVETSRRTGGTGLGLAIVKHIVNRHQGGLRIDSRVGGGTAITCYFPLVDAHRRREAGAEAAVASSISAPTAVEFVTPADPS